MEGCALAGLVCLIRFHADQAACPADFAPVWAGWESGEIEADWIQGEVLAFCPAGLDDLPRRPRGWVGAGARVCSDSAHVPSPGWEGSSAHFLAVPEHLCGVGDILEDIRVDWAGPRFGLAPVAVVPVVGWAVPAQ